MQKCNFTLRSFSYNNTDVDFELARDSTGGFDVSIDKELIQTTQQEVWTNIFVDNITISSNITKVYNITKAGNFTKVTRIRNKKDIQALISSNTSTFEIISKVQNEIFRTISVEFSIDRSYKSFAMSIYLPTALQVIASIFSLWYPLDDHATDRIVLLSSYCVPMIQLLLSTRSSIAESQKVSLLDIWIVVCIIFITFLFLQAIWVKFTLDKRRHIWEHAEEVSRRRLQLVEPQFGLRWFGLRNVAFRDVHTT